MSDRENNVEDDLSLPKTTVHKLITEMLPSDIACSKETREILIECCVEFIHLLASEANDVCEKESKKTIAAEHVITALQSLGFEEYIPHIQAVFQDHKNTMKIRDRKSSRLENSGLTEEELLRSQEELFAKARQRYQTQSGGSVSNTNHTPSYGSVGSMGGPGIIESPTSLSSNATFTAFSFPPPPM